MRQKGYYSFRQKKKKAVLYYVCKTKDKAISVEQLSFRTM